MTITVPEALRPLAETMRAAEDEQVAAVSAQFGFTEAEVRAVTEAMEAIRRTCSAACGRLLEGRRPDAEQRVSDARAEAEQADAACGPARTELERLRQVHADLAARLEAVPPKAGLDAAGRLERRRLRADLEAELGDLAGEIAAAETELSPLTAAAWQARADADRAEAELAGLERAIANPLASRAVIASEPARLWYSLTALSELNIRSDSVPARAAWKLTEEALVRSGYGEDIAREAIEAGRKQERSEQRMRRPGDPLVEMATMPDGSRVPLLLPPNLSELPAREAPPAAMVDSSDARVVSSRTRFGTPFENATTTPGLFVGKQGGQ